MTARTPIVAWVVGCMRESSDGFRKGIYAGRAMDILESGE
jgi:hypothetical protein